MRLTEYGSGAAAARPMKAEARAKAVATIVKSRSGG
jgi:hypothetical protein